MEEYKYFYVLAGNKVFGKRLDEAGFATNLLYMIRVHKNSRTRLANELRRQAKKSEKKFLGGELTKWNLKQV